MQFRDHEAVQRARERLEELTHQDLSPVFDQDLDDCPDPDTAITNLERWLRATSNPGTHAAHLLELRPLSRLLMILLGASQPLADSLIQNPELAGIVTDPDALSLKPTTESLLKEGRSLLANTTSYSHKLDRIRYLKQRWTLPLVVNDLAGLLPPQGIWQALSDLADACIILASEAAWEEFRVGRDLPAACPIKIVGFGKLGGHELNYSSDVDLVYVLTDASSLDDSTLGRFCDSLTRALTERMGRGFLYRVDLRLRPFGMAGPIAPTMRAMEAYYRSHAEVWEKQALIRSRVIEDSGGPDLLTQSSQRRKGGASGTDALLSPTWQDLVDKTCFAGPLSEQSFQMLAENRARIEQHAGEEDLKRGVGGIRDVEFLTQLLQMACGYKAPDVRVANTCLALKALAEHGILEQSIAAELVEGYTFLRQLEHRCQLVGDQQTHSIPAADEAREHLARLSGKKDWAELQGELKRRREVIRAIYGETIGQGPLPTPKRDLKDELGPEADKVFQWLDSLPESEAFYKSLEENEGSLQRARRVAEFAPALLDKLRGEIPLTESIFSGEIEEETGAADKLNNLPADAPIATLAQTLDAAWTRTSLSWAIGEGFELGSVLAGISDSLIRHAAKRLYAEIDIIALGSYATGDMGPTSDCDLLLLVKDSERHPEAETAAQQLLSLIINLKRHGRGLSVDLRLRPEGGKGLLVRTYGGLKTYELEDMEMWERFALGHARLVHGNPEALEVVLKTAYALPLTPERVKDLVAMKRRIETERVLPQHYKRQVKLGYGGLGDIEWFVHLHEMRFPTASEAGQNVRMEERMRALLRSQLINSVEFDELREARIHLLRARDRLALLGYEPDVLPENPDKLDRLAHAFGYPEGNEFLAYHERVIEAVRSIYLEGLERLRA